MDKVEYTANLIIKLNLFQNGELSDYEFIKEVCSYFDMIKSDSLSTADKQFLFYIANEVGIPQYYDTLVKFNHDIQFDEVSLQTLADSYRESRVYTSKNVELHKYQKDILDKFEVGKQNRFFLSASTSFGKTFLVYEIIRKMQYKNILLVFLSIALLSENLEKLGFKRIILSRETKLEDIKLIKEHTDLEIEYFVMGALCVAFSGNCYFSSMCHSKSGNRGK